MHIDALTTAALTAELRARAVGARVQDVVQIDRLTVSLELYRGDRHYLVLSADPQAEGLRLTPHKPRRGDTPSSPLALALAAHAEGRRLGAVDHPEGERILIFTFDADPPVRLVAELTGRLANLVLTGADGVILALARPVTAAMTRARVLLPGRPYVPPPTQLKALPTAVTVADVAGWLAARPDDLAAQLVVARMRGMGPLAAREAVARAAGDPAATAAAVDPVALHAALTALGTLPATGAWQPSVAYDPANPARVVAYAPYRLTHLPGVADAAGVCEAIEAFEAGRAGGDDGYRAARAAVASLIDEARARLSRQRAALEREHVDAAAIEAARLYGDLILAFQREIRPGQAVLAAPLDPDAPTIIALDPSLTPVENAERYYQRHRRARRAAAALPERLALVDAQIATLDQLATDAALAEDRPGIDVVHEALRVSGLLGRPLPRRTAGGSPGAGKPLTVVSDDGFTILVGRNSRQNEVVTFERAARGDVWLHARDVPGAHVVIKAAGRPVPDRTLREAAALAAWFSRARDRAVADVAVTDVRHVRRLRGGGPGMVTVARADTVTVSPAAPG